MFSDFLIEEGLRQTNPVGRGRYTPGCVERTSQGRGILPRVVTTPWIPSEDQWRVVIHSIRRQTVRTRTMFALSYECALRREEVCSLRIDDFDPSLKLLRVRAEVAKNRRERIVPYTSAVSPLLGEYLRLRRKVKSRDPRHLFLSESRATAESLCPYGHGRRHSSRSLSQRASMNSLRIHCAISD